MRKALCVPLLSMYHIQTSCLYTVLFSTKMTQYIVEMAALLHNFA